MKMPEKHDLIVAAILAAKEEQASGGNPCTMAYLRGRYNGGAFFYKNSNKRNDVRHYRLVHSWPSHYAGLSSNISLI